VRGDGVAHCEVFVSGAASSPPPYSSCRGAALRAWQPNSRTCCAVFLSICAWAQLARPLARALHRRARRVGASAHRLF